MSINVAEEWRPVVGYEGWYSVSNIGRVRRDRGGKGTLPGLILKLAISNVGYPNVQLSKDAAIKRVLVHSLVAAAFIGLRPSGLHINHKNGDKLDNHVSNLEYVTVSENVRHALRTGLATAKKGEDAPGARLTEVDVVKIRVRYSKGEEIDSIASDFGIHRRHVDAIARGKFWPEALGPITRRGRPKGEKVARSVLTEAKVRELKRRCADGESYLDVARDMGISLNAAFHVVTFRTWRNIGMGLL